MELMSNEKPRSVHLLVAKEQALDLLEGIKLTLAANSFIAITMAMSLWEMLPRDVIVFWLAALLVVNVARAFIIFTLVKSGSLEFNPHRFLRVNWIGALLSGCLWSALNVILFVQGSGLSPIAILVMIGITAGAVIQNRSHRASSWAFVVPIALSDMLGFLCLSRSGTYLILINVILYYFMLLRSAAKTEVAFIAKTRLQLDADDLTKSLQHANSLAYASAKRLEYMANFDPLTGLGNRVAFNDRFNKALEAARSDESEVTLLLIDLDRFKAINDTFGHATGDQVLVEVARRIREELAETDFAARLGGDEFALILANNVTSVPVADIAAGLISSITKPIAVTVRPLNVGASIGYSLYPRDGYNMEELQICADVALYAAKSEGRGTARAFDENLRNVTDARRVFELDLADAIADGYLDVWFQPQVSLHDQKLVGLEALIRWNHPNHGWVSPPEIVAAAAATRQSDALTGYVLAASCRMIRALTLAGCDDVTVSFNVSPQELGRYSLVDLIARSLAMHDVSASRLGLEITEEAIFSQERSGDELRAIAAMGVNIAVDDFGVGYSSFGALRNLKFDYIKIDKVFVQGILEGPDDRALVQAILGVARALGVNAIAEGVETAEQAAMLAALGCNEVQGYYFAKPMPAASAMEWISGRLELPPVKSTRAKRRRMPGVETKRKRAAIGP